MEKKVDLCLRLKKNVCIKIEEELWSELKMLGLEPGNSFFNQEVTIRKTAPITGFNLAGKWLGKYRNITTFITLVYSDKLGRYIAFL
ncbi:MULTISPECIES: hypothetical protein [unclassified Microcoleus]|uniref:hypothetical protein n=1 Tax=unclassified Microcoleus TaxID=2642155 RepID=UPI002FCFF9FC